LNVAVAWSFSLCATTMVASTSSTTTSAGKAMPAAVDAGRPPGIKLHTRARVLARAWSIRFSAAGVSSSRVRHTVGGEATAPNTSC
jgi:hypothetical protein